MRVAGQEDDQENLQQQGETSTEDLPENEQAEDEPQDGADGEPDEGGEEGEDEVVVQIGDEEPAASEEAKAAPEWVKELRKRRREDAKRIAELEAKLSTGQPAAQAKPELPKKPRLDDPDIDYDAEKYEQARDAWEARKREVDAFEATQRSAQEAQAKRVQAVEDHYAATAKALKVKDFREAEDEVDAVFDQVQGAILKAGASNPAAMVYALGKNPKRLQELASIKDPVKFAFAAGELQGKLTVTQRKSTKPAPETPLRSNSSAPASTATLDRLRAEADRTGDRSKVAAYLRQQKSAGK